MIVLDTNVISALMKSNPDRRVVDWLNDQSTESIWTTSVCLFEILFGLNVMTKGKRRETLQSAFEQALIDDLGGRVLDFDSSAAREAATISAKLCSKGAPVEIRDVQIAGIVSARKATLATRNTKHFLATEIKLIDPWQD
jgi:predicted nucleic acid-binding protein